MPARPPPACPITAAVREMKIGCPLPPHPPLYRRKLTAGPFCSTINAACLCWRLITSQAPAPPAAPDVHFRGFHFFPTRSVRA
jgi:hypothetical protein